MSDTPRTDDADWVWLPDDFDQTAYVAVKFARTLERELAAAQSTIAAQEQDIAYRDNVIHDLQTQQIEQAKEIERLEQLVYVPGLWKCAKCNLTIVSNTIHYPSGALSANTEPQQCANGCGPMWRVTERDAGNDLVDRMTPMQEHIAAQAKEFEHLKAVALRYRDLWLIVHENNPLPPQEGEVLELGYLRGELFDAASR